MAPSLLFSRPAAVAWKLPLSASELETAISAMLEAAGRAGAWLELAIMDDGEMERLHAEALGCSGPTNTLAFPEFFPAEGEPLSAGIDPATFLGSIAFSVDTFERECFLYGQEPVEHCLRLLSHAAAHLFGLDHGPAMDALSRRMEIAALAVCPKI